MSAAAKLQSLYLEGETLEYSALARSLAGCPGKRSLTVTCPANGPEVAGLLEVEGLESLNFRAPLDKEDDEYFNFPAFCLNLHLNSDLRSLCFREYSYAASDLLHLGQALLLKENLERLGFEHMVLDTYSPVCLEDWKPVLSSLAKSSSIRSLKFPYMGFERDILDHVVDIFGQCLVETGKPWSVRRLNLENNPGLKGFTEKLVSIFNGQDPRCLKTDPSQEYHLLDLNLLSMHQDSSDSDRIRLWASTLAHPSPSRYAVRKLTINSNTADPESWSLFFKALCTNKTLTRLTIKNSNIGPAIHMLGRALQENVITHLKLEFCGLTGEHLEVLAPFLKVNSSLTHLSLSNMKFSGPDRYRALADVLKFNKSIRHLDISGSKITAQSEFYAVTQAVVDHNDTLVSLSMDSPEYLNHKVSEILRKVECNKSS